MVQSGTRSVGRSITDVYRRTIPMAFVAIIAVIMILEYFIVPWKPLTDAKVELTKWGTIVAAATAVYSQIVLILFHARRLKNYGTTPRRRFFDSSVYIATLITMLAIGWFAPGGEKGETFQLLMMYPAGLAVVGLTVAGIAAHNYISYRLFSRVRSIESALMLITFLFVTIRQATAIIYFVPPLEDIGWWFMSVPHVAAMRAATGAAGVGAIIMGLRAIVGREPGLVELERIEEKK